MATNIPNSVTSITHLCRRTPCLCKVCGDAALYSYFGAIVCYACKMFFKRNANNLQRNFKCNNNYSCEININTRQHCSYCRLTKCFLIGMDSQMIRSSRLTNHTDQHTKDFTSNSTHTNITTIIIQARQRDQVTVSRTSRISNQEFPNLIQIKQNKNKRQLDENEQPNKRVKSNHISFNSDQFDQIFGPAKLYLNNLIANNNERIRSFIAGRNLYSTGKHYLNIKIERVNKTDISCFFGIMTADESMRDLLTDMESVYGVWSSGYNVICGQRFDSEQFKRWEEKDILNFTFDCDNKQVIIENNRIGWYQILDIDIDYCPFPWKFLTLIKGYKLRIIADS